jgi:predicted N-formylglutamate amidohydrolase
MARPISLLITCEHGGNQIPPRYRRLFRGHEELLESHRGHDPGALLLAKELAATFKAPLFFATVSRLLIELNRSVGHPKLYSDITRNAPAEVRREIFETCYLPYRSQVEAHIAKEVAKGRQVVHISSHSFTPVLDGAVRNADVGLLYDPGRRPEAAFCSRWQVALQVGEPELRVRRNYPYTGKADGFTAYLRRRFSQAAYVGIELEINQKHATRGGRHWKAVRNKVLQALGETVSAGGTRPRRTAK